MTEHCDVIVIGSGAGGGTLTHTLVPTGTGQQAEPAMAAAGVNRSA